MHPQFWNGLAWGLLIAVVASFLGFMIGGGCL